MKKTVLIFDALFPYLTLLCVAAMSQAGLWPLAALCIMWAVLFTINCLFLVKRCKDPDAESLNAVDILYNHILDCIMYNRK